MKNTTKKLIASSLALGLAAATTAGSTFAWFSNSTTAQATGISMTAQAGEGLFVSLHKEYGYAKEADLSNFYSINSSAVTAALKTTEGDGAEFKAFDAMSTVDGSTFKYATGVDNLGAATKFTYENVKSLPVKISNTDPAYSYTFNVLYVEINDNFYATGIQFDLYFAMTKDTEKDIYLAKETSVSPADPANYYTVSAFRLGTKADVTAVLDVKDETNFAGSTSQTNMSANDDALTEYLANSGATADAGFSKLADLGTNSLSLAEDFIAPNHIDGTSETKIATHGTASRIASGVDNTGTPNQSTQEFININGTWDVYKVTFTTWFEGNDYDCYSKALEGVVEAELQFKADN